jgi:hypothetical protein
MQLYNFGRIVWGLDFIPAYNKFWSKIETQAQKHEDFSREI